jgi:putative DNA primase/helicase
MIQQSKDSSDIEAVLWLCEGESDTICALSHGLEAITATGGAGSWAEEGSGIFRGRDVVIAYDADLAGYNGAHKVAAKLKGLAARVRILLWPDEMLEPEPVNTDSTGQASKRIQAAQKATDRTHAKKYVPYLPAKHGLDLTDYLVKLGHSVADLESLLDNAEDIQCNDLESPVDIDDPELIQLYAAGNSMVRFKAVLSIDGKEAYRAPLACREFMQNNQLIHEAKTGKIYLWNGKYWADISEAELKGLLAEFMGLAASRGRLGELMELVKIKTTLPLDQDMDLEPKLLNLKNGMLDLDSGRLLPHDPACRCTHLFPYDWTPHDPPQCSRFRRAALEIIADPEVLEEVLEFFGYCFWPGQQYKKALFLVGPKDCGKSLLQEVLRQLLGPDNCSAISMDELEKNFDRVMLHRKMANICGEASADFFNSNVFKRLTGGDPIYAAYKGVDGFTFDSSAKLFFSANEKPVVRDKSDAFYERMIMVECPRQFKLGHPRTDPYLKEILMEELPGIFHLVLMKLYNLRKRGGFSQSRRSQAVLNAYRLESDHVVQFVDDCCEFKTHDGLNVEGPKSVVYKAYQAWAEEMGIKSPKDAARFWQSIRQSYPSQVEFMSKGPKNQNPKRPPWVKGLYIKEDLEDRAFLGG